MRRAWHVRELWLGKIRTVAALCVYAEFDGSTLLVVGSVSRTSNITSADFSGTL